MNSNAFSERLKELMDAENISRRSLSACTRLQRKSIINWLDGKFCADYKGLIALSKFFQVKIEYLLGLSEKYETANKIDINIADVPKIFSGRLKSLLEQQGITVYAFSKVIGIQQSTVSRWFTGNSVPEAESLIKISTKFSVSVDYLLGLE